MKILRDTRHLRAKQVAVMVNRPVSAVHNMRWKYGYAYTGKMGRSGDLPGDVAGRTLVAKTCIKCGLVLSGHCFTRKGKGTGKQWYESACRKCLNVTNVTRQNNVGKYREMERKRTDAYQEASLPTADRAGQEYTDQDHRVLADRTLTTLEKAIATRRTYKGVASSIHRLGYTSRPDLAAILRDGRWVIDNPNEVAA